MLIATPKDLGRFHRKPPYIGKDVRLVTDIKSSSNDCHRSTAALVIARILNQTKYPNQANSAITLSVNSHL